MSITHQSGFGPRRLTDTQSPYIASGIGAGIRYEPTSALEELEMELADAESNPALHKPLYTGGTFDIVEYQANRRALIDALATVDALKRAINIVRRWS